MPDHRAPMLLSDCNDSHQDTTATIPRETCEIILTFKISTGIVPLMSHFLALMAFGGNSFTTVTNLHWIELPPYGIHGVTNWSHTTVYVWDPPSYTHNWNDVVKEYDFTEVERGTPLSGLTWEEPFTPFGSYAKSWSYDAPSWQISPFYTYTGYITYKQSMQDMNPSGSPVYTPPAWQIQSSGSDYAKRTADKQKDHDYSYTHLPKEEEED